MTSSEEIKKQLEELQAALEEAKELLAPVTSQYQEIQSTIFATETKYNEQISALTKEKNEIVGELKKQKAAMDNSLYQAQSKVNQVSWDINAKAQLLEKQLQEEEAAAHALQVQINKEKADKEHREQWEKLLVGIKWREWAKEHQITGAQKIVQDRYVIVADSMGLGKTLTAIATCDMAELGSREASTENPWGGFSEQQFVPEYWERPNTGEILKGYIPYDKKKNLQEDPTWVFHEGRYEDVISNAIERPVGRRILYLCPATLLTNVLNEYRHWAPHRNAVYIGGFTKAERNWVLDQVTKVGDYVIICNYEAWRRDKALLETLNNLEFDTVIIDEAHNIKDMKSVAYKGVEELVLKNHRPEFVIPMTGTPVLNKPQELFTLLHLVNPTDFYNVNAYLRTYCEQYWDNNGNPKWKFQDGGLDRLAKRIRPNFLRRTREDANLELPPKTTTLHELELDEENYPEQARARSQMRKFATIIIDEQKGKALSALAKIAIFGRLRQIETWPAGIIQYQKDSDGKIMKDPVTGEKIIKLQVDIEESQKLDYIIRYDEEEKEFDGLIPQVVPDERVVVFSQFKAPLEELARRITASGFRPVIFNGDTPSHLREEIILDFDNKFTPKRKDSKWDVVLCHYQVGGVGLNLTAATQMVILDEQWNPGKRDQAYDRIHRMGQDKPVTIHVVRNTPTIDNWLADIVAEKDKIVGSFEEAMENATSNDDILDALNSGLI